MRLREADIYFVRNIRDRWTQVAAIFRDGRGRRAELWDPVNGGLDVAYEPQTTGDGVAVPLRLAPHGSIFVVFRSPATEAAAESRFSRYARSAARTRLLRMTNCLPRHGSWHGTAGVHACTVSRPGNYRVATPAGRRGGHGDRRPARTPDARGPLGAAVPRRSRGTGADPARPAHLLDRTPRRKGPALLRAGRLPARFQAAGGLARPRRRVRIDLGRLWSTASVSLNGHPIGTVWTPPYALDVTAAARPGPNTLVVEVANTWSNRLAGDARSPAASHVARTNITASHGIGWKDVPLIPSGLFGPVRLVPERELRRRATLNRAGPPPSFPQAD